MNIIRTYGLTISIHAPAKGATQRGFPLSSVGIISIHAPAKGATIPVCNMVGRYFNFNPRSREGSDLSPASFAFHASRFQSTLPRRERLRMSYICFGALSFQSTLPRRERQKLEILYRWWTVFQSTLPRRERLPTQSSISAGHLHFNPRSREGSDSAMLLHVISLSDFNPRSREGSDMQLSPWAAMQVKFQSTLPRRERHKLE